MMPMVLGQYDCYIEDKVSGRNLEVTSFEDEYGIIDNLLYDEQMTHSYNLFNGEFGHGFNWNKPYNDFYYSDDIRFNGNMRFNDLSSVKYSLKDFVVEENYLDPWGSTAVWGTATFEYEMVVVIKKSVPVDVLFDFYQDPEFKDDWFQNIFIEGEDLLFELEGTGERSTFSHDIKTEGDCE